MTDPATPPQNPSHSHIGGGVHGDVVGGDKVMGDKVGRDKVSHHTTINQAPEPSPGPPNTHLWRWLVSAGIVIAIVSGLVAILSDSLNVVGFLATETPIVTVTPTATTTPIPTETPQPTPATPLAGATRVITLTAGVEVVQVYVAEGEFPMGSNEFDADADLDETPQRNVFVAGFWIDQTEVTNEMFKAFVDQTHYVTVAEKEGDSWVWVSRDDEWEPVPEASWRKPNGYDPDVQDFEKHPVVQIAFVDAIEFCEWIKGRRLPTEAEWEKAARGTDRRRYPWGNQKVSPARLNLRDATFEERFGTGRTYEPDDGYPMTAPVGSFPAGASPYGALDMAGNVWEFVSDAYAPYPESTSGETVEYEQGYYVLRGGSFFDASGSVRTANRSNRPPENPDPTIGFRCVGP